MIPTSILHLFGHSPIRPLQDHMLKVAACVELLPAFLAEALKQDWQAAQELQTRIANLEREADELKRDLRLHLPKSIFMPVARNDVLELLIAQDAIANKARDVAGLILGRRMQFPAAITVATTTLVQKSTEAVFQANKAIGELDEVVASGFRGIGLKVINEMIVELDRLEHESDKIQVAIRHELFKQEKSLPPVDVVFLYKMVEWVGDLADRAHHVGGKLMMLLAK